MESKDQKEVFEATSIEDWRSWLDQNADSASLVYLVLYSKKSGIPSITYVEAVEHALCYGWIDSKKMKRDENSVFQTFTKRKPNSGWAKSNKERVARLTEQGFMRPQGQAMIDLAKKNGSWDKLTDVENEIWAPDLTKAFNKNKKAKANFEAFAPSARKMILQWIYAAKRPETREKRILEAVEKAEENRKAY